MFLIAGGSLLGIGVFEKGIKKGSTMQHTNIPDIAPTISALLGISFPNGATGKPLEFVLEN